MQNNSTYDYESIDSVMFYIYTYFGYEDVKDMDVYSAAQIVLPMIGNTHMETYHFIGKADEFAVVKIPCNVEKIESVSVGSDNYKREFDEAINVYPRQINDMQAYLYMSQTKSNLHAPGSFINYKFTGSSIEIDPAYRDVELYIIYKGFIADKDGNPMVTSREAIAVAHYYNYLRQQRSLFNGTGDANLLAMAKQNHLESLSNARSPVYISQNEWDQLKKIHTSGNRWKYNRPYKYNV